MAGSAFIESSVRDSVGILELKNGPGNIIPRPDFIAVDEITQMASRPEVKAILVRGSGRHFSAGADLEELFKLASDPEQLFEKMDEGKKILNTIEDLKLPVLAEVSGSCFGGGLEIALSCHFRFISEQSLLAFPEINHNLMPGLGGSVRLTRLIGESRALSVLLSGDIFDAKQAFAIGLADRILPKSELPLAAFSFLQRLVDSKPKEVIQTLMQAWQNSRHMSTEAALKEETTLFCQMARAEYLRRINA